MMDDVTPMMDDVTPMMTDVTPMMTDVTPMMTDGRFAAGVHCAPTIRQLLSACVGTILCFSTQSIISSRISSLER
jgi:hypothetical protein